MTCARGCCPSPAEHYRSLQFQPDGTHVIAQLTAKVDAVVTKPDGTIREYGDTT
jgi:hypothetical protein